MDANNKYVSQEALEYFLSGASGQIVGKDDELTMVDFANENNIIVVWGAGTKIKCAAPINVDFETKFIYLGTLEFYDSPDNIEENNSDTQQTVWFGSNDEYILVRTRSSSSDPWPNTFNTMNSDPLWNEKSKRTNIQTAWVTSSGTVIDASSCTGDSTKGKMSPWTTAYGNGTIDLKPIYGYQ